MRRRWMKVAGRLGRCSGDEEDGSQQEFGQRVAKEMLEVVVKMMGMGLQQDSGRRVAKEMMEVVKMWCMGRVAGNGGVFLCLVWVMTRELQVLVIERCR